MTATAADRTVLPFDPLGAHRAQLRDLRRRHRDVDLVLRPTAPDPEGPVVLTPPAPVDRDALVAAVTAVVAVVEEVVGRPVDDQHRSWQGGRLVLGAAHHDLAPGEALCLLRRLLRHVGDLEAWSVLPVASRRPSVLLWQHGVHAQARVRAWPRALTLHTVGVADGLSGGLTGGLTGGPAGGLGRTGGGANR